jgi:hypothetical protein
VTGAVGFTQAQSNGPRHHCVGAISGAIRGMTIASCETLLPFTASSIRSAGSSSSCRVSSMSSMRFGTLRCSPSARSHIDAKMMDMFEGRAAPIGH